MNKKEEIKAKIIGKTQNKKLPCKLAFQLAEEFGAELKEIGEIANELDIKITNCQLGCFK